MKPSQSLSKNLCVLAGDAHEVTDSLAEPHLKEFVQSKGWFWTSPGIKSHSGFAWLNLK